LNGKDMELRKKESKEEIEKGKNKERKNH